MYESHLDFYYTALIKELGVIPLSQDFFPGLHEHWGMERFLFPKKGTSDLSSL